MDKIFLGISILFFINSNLLNAESNVLNFQSEVLKQLLGIFTSKELIAPYIGLSAAITTFLVYYLKEGRKRKIY